MHVLTYMERILKHVPKYPQYIAFFEKMKYTHIEEVGPSAGQDQGVLLPLPLASLGIDLAPPFRTGFPHRYFMGPPSLLASPPPPRDYSVSTTCISDTDSMYRIC